MDYGLIFFLIIGIAFIIGGWKVTFTKDGLEWMYKSGIWKRKPPQDHTFSEEGWERLNRIRGSGFLIFGIIVVIMIAAIFFIKPYGI